MAEVMHPPFAEVDREATVSQVVTQPIETTGPKPVWPPEMPTATDLLSSTPQEIFSHQPTETQPERTIFTNPMQQKVASEWLPVRENVPASVIYEVLRDKSRELNDKLSKLTREERNGDMDDETKAELIKLMRYTVVGTIDFLTEKNIDVDKALIRKMLVMEVKYNPDAVAEIRHHGTPESPGRTSVRDAMLYLKAHYSEDEVDEYGVGKQEYQVRGLPLPDEEQKARTIDVSVFSDKDQRFVTGWQAQAFGVDIDADSVIIPNMTGENGELLQEPENSEKTETYPNQTYVINNDSYWKISRRVCGTGIYYRSIQAQNNGRALYQGDAVIVNCSF